MKSFNFTKKVNLFKIIESELLENILQYFIVKYVRYKTLISCARLPGYPMINQWTMITPGLIWKSYQKYFLIEIIWIITILFL